MAADLIDITGNILSQNHICFETRLYEENTKFGILNFKAVTAEETTEELDIIFTVDCSGSMSDKCGDRRSKMDQTIHTLKNMISFFHEHPTVIANITVIAFDTTIYRIIDRIRVNENNYNDLIKRVDTIRPRGSTNIEFALNKSAELINRIRTEYPNNIISHIFMTDGEATDGNCEPEFLKTLVLADVKNAFIGFGTDHDAGLLNALSSVSGDSGYYFVDKLELAGLVYGEILHGIVYKLLTKAEIIIENGVIYDFKTNEWVTNLYIGDIVSEMNKTYNIKSESPSECKVNIKANMDGLTVLFPATFTEGEEDEDTKLDAHIYRQKTLELLYEVNQFVNRSKTRESPRHLLLPNNNGNSEKAELKAKLCRVLEEIKKYMTDNGLEDDKMLKNLCDDIYICYKSFDTRYGTMFCAARQTSQGSQRQYMTTTIDVLDRRRNAIPITLDDDLPSHTLSNFAETPYMTLQTTQIMYEISGIHDNNDDDGYNNGNDNDDDLVSVSTQQL